jgi:glycerol-3-phosphate dehydrogenase
VGATQLSGDGATLRDELSGTTFDVRAKAVVNATGVWAGELIDDIKLRPSRGTHLVVGLDSLGGLAGQLTVPVPGEHNRWVIVIAQRTGVAYIGLTDEAQTGPIPDVPIAPEKDIDFLLDTLNATLARPLTRDDVVGTYAGLRPLVESDAEKSADLSRKHAVIRSGGGLVSIVGGKLTTYRKMAEDAVDAAVDAGGLTNVAGRCRTKDLPLVGAAPRDALAAVAAPRRLVDRHGTLAPDVLALAGGDPQLLAPLLPGLDVLAVEVLYAVEYEGALDAGDVLDRRTRIGLVEDDRVQVRPVVDALLGESGQASAA